MIELGENLPKGCPARRRLDHVTNKWGVLVIVALAGDMLRWSGLLRAANGISEKMLAQTLKVLADEGLVVRRALEVVPPHVEYSLTPEGREVASLLIPLVEWAARGSDLRHMSALAAEQQ
ncbi:winged helix-turn-helix transcriptional regulator [Arthrobacter ginkgonis]